MFVGSLRSTDIDMGQATTPQFLKE